MGESILSIRVTPVEQVCGSRVTTCERESR